MYIGHVPDLLVSCCFSRAFAYAYDIWGPAMCTISYNSCTRLVFVDGVWVSYVHFIIQLVPIQFLREMEGVFFQRDDARLPETLRQLSWPASSPRLPSIETRADVRNWTGSRVLCHCREFSGSRQVFHDVY